MYLSYSSSVSPPPDYSTQCLWPLLDYSATRAFNKGHNTCYSWVCLMDTWCYKWTCIHACSWYNSLKMLQICYSSEEQSYRWLAPLMTTLNSTLYTLPIISPMNFSAPPPLGGFTSSLPNTTHNLHFAGNNLPIHFTVPATVALNCENVMPRTGVFVTVTTCSLGVNAKPAETSCIVITG